MFKSQLSGKQFDAGVKPRRVVTEYRQVQYKNDDRVSQGTEIVKELLIGPDEVAPQARLVK